jgi:hypothetical protein
VRRGRRVPVGRATGYTRLPVLIFELFPLFVALVCVIVGVCLWVVGRTD